MGSNGSHFVWPPIPTWFNHGRRAYTHESSRAVTSATTSSIVPVPQLSLLCWIRPGLADLFSQLEGGDSSKSCTPSEGKSPNVLIIESVWNARQSRKAIFEGSAGTWSNFVKEIGRFEHNTWTSICSFVDHPVAVWSQCSTVLKRLSSCC